MNTNTLYEIDPELDQSPAGLPTQNPGDPADRPPTGAACIPNISTAERRKRLMSGLVAFSIGVAILVFLVATGADRLWRLPLFLLFASGATGFFQWRDKT